MVGVISENAGILILPESETGKDVILDLVRKEKCDPVESQYLYSSAQDWKKIEGKNTQDLLEKATQAYWIARTVSLFRIAIAGLEESLEKRVLEEIEDNLMSRNIHKKVLNQLLIAPLKDPKLPFMLASSAIKYGCATVAALLDDLMDLQPLLNRLSEVWLKIPEVLFHSFPGSRQAYWSVMIENCEMKKLLNTSDGIDFNAQLNLLAFHFTSPELRSSANLIAKKLSQQLFPHQEKESIDIVDQQDSDELGHPTKKGQTLNDHEAFLRVTKQIEAIALALSKGHDSKAEKFLRELIQQQITSSDKSYVLKSLCNIAQQCADMFRVDFESYCLSEANRIDPYDAWTLIQLGDHKKRIGEYSNALTYLAEAEKLGENIIAKSSEADIYSRQGDYEKAILTYQSIPNWEDEQGILTGIADTLRKMGRFDEAEEKYFELIQWAKRVVLDYPSVEARAQIGIAEIAKKKGRLEEAAQIYSEVLEVTGLDDRVELFGKLSLSNILKSLGQFDSAYSIVDKIIQQYPYAIEARFLRGSILGLIGKEHEGLEDLPESHLVHSWREWLRQYYRGLLMLKLKRYDEAKKSLVEEFPKAIASKEEKTILRMAAALFYLSEDEIATADNMLLETSDLSGLHAQYLSLVLKLHSATRKEDLDTINVLKKQLENYCISDASLLQAVTAINERNFPRAIIFETEAFLKLAA